ncbi:tetratricopeptide repeat-containing response regulator [uncultured Oxalicibacterium sp.]|uniref:tetratricopeptide repeat-containing response regulator n=1 Tax=uncultured Oxalicibacterium sp. TaxID=1168540 RepID=UPI0025EB913F|nr:tetratricopeptide repeat-containing response regulator [uncultured Oxalicibacterium sp.]
MTLLAGLTALIIDPHAGMRANIHGMLAQGGVTRIEYAVSAGNAIRPLRHKHFDLIICEYDLGEGQDGQQLLEDLRHNRLLPSSTVFIMVTAERTHDKVVSAAELALNDYILKPFTADMLLERITRAIEKRNALQPIRQFIDDGNLAGAIEACVLGARQAPRYAQDFLRQQAELHVMLGELTEAEAIYADLFDKRALGWARLGQATALHLQGRFADAESMLQELVTQKPQFLEAYDWLARAQEEQDRVEDAQRTLEAAVTRSPHAVQRLRRLGRIALEAGDVGAAHRTFQQVVNKARYSEFREPEDHVRLVETALEHGETQLVTSIIRDLGKSLAHVPKTALCRALSMAMLHRHNGESDAAVEALQTAVTESREPISLSVDARVLLARNCLQSGLEHGAIEVMTTVIGNTPAGAAMARALRLFHDAGREDLAKRVTRDSKSQVLDLVAAGAEKARLGDYRGAVDLMSEAATRLPENPQVVFNAAVATLKCLDNEGWDDELGERARDYVAAARRLDPRNPRLSLLGSMYRDLLKKYALNRSDRYAVPAGL